MLQLAPFLSDGKRRKTTESDGKNDGKRRNAIRRDGKATEKTTEMRRKGNGNDGNHKGGATEKFPPP